MTRRTILYLIVFLLGYMPAMAQQRMLQIASGTGFYINKEGDLITNQHVVRGCQSIVVKTPQGNQPAQIVATDRQRDLAILRTSSTPPGIAPLRWNIKDLRIGDAMYVYGFPGEEGLNGMPTFLHTKLTKLDSLNDTPERLYLERVIHQGNSGGPVLDGSGNVIAVISGYVETYALQDSKPGGNVDIAITLAALQDFLKANMASYYESASGMVNYAEPVIVKNAASFTFPVICVLGSVTR